MDKSHPVLYCSAESATAHGGWSPLLCLCLYFFSIIFCCLFHLGTLRSCEVVYRVNDEAAAWHVALMLKKKNSIRGSSVNGWVFDATLSCCCSEQKEGCVREQRQCRCVHVWAHLSYWSLSSLGLYFIFNTFFYLFLQTSSYFHRCSTDFCYFYMNVLQISCSVEGKGGEPGYSCL